MGIGPTRANGNSGHNSGNTGETIRAQQEERNMRKETVTYLVTKTCLLGRLFVLKHEF